MNRRPMAGGDRDLFLESWWRRDAGICCIPDSGGGGGDRLSLPNRPPDDLGPLCSSCKNGSRVSS